MPADPNVDRRDFRRSRRASGLIAERPARGDVNEEFWATDEAILYYGTGTGWEKGPVQDYADLDGIPSSFTPDLTAHLADADPHTQYQRESEKAAANGYASLDAGTLVPFAQLGTGTATGLKFLRDDRTWAAPSGGPGGGPTTGTAVLDFGTFPGSNVAYVDVATAGVISTSIIDAWIRPVASADHTDTDHIAAQIRVTGVYVSDNNIRVYGINANDVTPPLEPQPAATPKLRGVLVRTERQAAPMLVGQFNVNWSWI